MKTFQAHIDSVAFKGYGVARLHGKVIFIPYTAGGDEAWVEITEEKKNYSIGKLTRMITPSPQRVKPRCPYFGECGGCQWQHIADSMQGELKKEILTDLLKRLGGMEKCPPVTVFPAPQSYGYRARVQLKTKGNKLGYYREKSHRILDIHECPIAHPLITQTIPWLRKAFSSFSDTEEVEINVSPDEAKGILIFQSLSRNRSVRNILTESLENQVLFKGMAVVNRGEVVPFGDPALTFTILPDEAGKREIKLRVSPGSFSQINPEQNQTLIRTVLRFAGTTREERVFDLYSGVGNLAIPLAAQAKEILGIEENKIAVEDARFNAERNGIRNCEFIQGRVEDAFRNWKRGIPDLLILDPPRTGSKTILEQVAGLKPKKMIYISCEPTTFSRDIRLLAEKGYSLQEVALIDMFPQTYHMEVVGMLTPD